MINLPFDSVIGIVLSFSLAFIIIALFSIYYVRKYTDLENSIRPVTITAVLSLVLSLLTCSLLPVDIFIVSLMKNSNGSFKEWAINITSRDYFENKVLNCYYAIYSLIFIFIFFIIPFMYFYFQEKEENFIFDNNPAWTSFKYTLLFVLLASILLMIGAFVPLRPIPDPNKNATWIDKFKNIINVLEKNRGEDALSMVLSILTAIGVTNVAIFTAYGMFSWPVSFIKGTKSARNQMQEIEERHLNITFNINCLKEKLKTTGSLSQSEMTRLQRLEEQQRINNFEERLVNLYRSSLFYKFRFILRPVQIFFGILIVLISIFIWISLVITNIDKAFHSLGMKMGYALTNSTFINPMDFMLSHLQTVYPLDYILVLIISFSLVMYTISGFKHLGIRIFFIRLYKIVPSKTAPQALLILFASVMITILGINVLFYSAFPQYTTYGHQYFLVANETRICALDSPKDLCTMTRMSALLIRFFYKAWFFGAYYYWAMWAFLLVSLLSFIYVTMKPKQQITEGLLEEDQLEDI